MVALEILEAAENGDISALNGFGLGVVTEDISDDFGSNCLHYAARRGGADILRFFIQTQGFKGNKRSLIGATPAHDAAAAGNLQAVQWLLENTACAANDQDGTGATILHLACRFHHTHITEWLLDRSRCDVSIRTASGGVPIHFAVVGDDYDAVKLLLEEDPLCVNAQTSNGATPTYMAAQEGHVDILRLLVQHHRGNVKMKAYDGMSCVHAAAQSGHLDCVRLLVDEEKCNANERDFDGATPLHYAASQGHYLVIDWLMGVGGARVTLDNLGGSPLHNAAESNQIQCVQVLINNGCSADITDNTGLTAAELSRKCFHDKCAHFIDTYQAQNQSPQDPDVVYLASVQSPRPHLVPVNGEVARPSLLSGVEPAVTPLPPRSTPSRSPRVDRRVESSPALGYNKKQPVARARSAGQVLLPSERGETGSISSHLTAQADSDEFPIGVPRSGSKDFSIDFQLNGTISGEDSSSLSSLSHLDDVINMATKQIYDSEQARKAASDKARTSLVNGDANGTQDKQRTSVVSANGTQQQTGQPEPNSDKNSALKGGYTTQAVKEPKIVTFRSETEDIDGANGHDVDEINGDLATVQLNGNGIEENADTGFSETNASSSPNSNGDIVTNGLPVFPSADGNMPQRDENMNGFVDSAHGVSATSTALHANSSQYNSAQTGLVKPRNSGGGRNVVSIEISSLRDSAQPAVNGTHNNTSPSSQPVPRPRSSIPPAPHSPQISSSTNHIQTNGMDPVPPSAPPAPPAPPPPPPPPPPPSAPPAPPPITAINRTGPQLNGTGNQPAHLPNGMTANEVKTKSASLPARPTFSAEMMMNKRSTLTPAPAKQTTSQKPNTDFIAELKLATKGTGLRRTSKVDENGGQPTMIFSLVAGQKTNGTTTKQPEKKEAKVELTGEWDPKNFVDQVPNKDNLPAWKVQLQAKQIAEKIMKETLEKRKVEEREMRFANMPAWKRALVEKKEAEQKAAEEKRQQEQQQKPKASNKKVPTIAMNPKSNGGEATLAPWQLELQKE